MRIAPRYRTVAEASDFVGLSIHTVLARIHSGDLIASNVSSGTQRARWRIADEELTRWLTSRQSGPTPRITRRRRTAAITEFV